MDDNLNQLFETRSREAKRGYFLNPDETFTKDLLSSLITNNGRYGYPTCPCRLATGDKKQDLDIICPCDYRDQDLLDYNTCYCGLYVSQKLIKNNEKIKPIPDRKNEARKNKMDQNQNEKNELKLSYPIWRCSVCGYICARNEAPEICPICGATHDRFEQFLN